ncbi:Spy/CpxP family protein refolding chaperone [Acidomonas methanolica]|uniref:Spy/CpxP family protein refolding chaperone n=1 Tax=Acidomonas methanolica TaxID=437 RepID=UPI00211A60D2|nr:periplasmic heavy metal sensor [Acidomonas methanolica]MCQ9156931.1 periplasmic heavy metal sensor [Acidomonas methanolica]
MSKKLFLVMALGVTGALAGGSGRAQDASPPMPLMMQGAHRMMKMGLLAGVDLTPEQKAELDAMRKDNRDTMRAKMGRMRLIDGQIAAVLMADGPVDRSKLAGLAQQKAALMDEGRQAWIDAAIKVHDLLTPQQLATARSVHEKMESLRSQMHALMTPTSQAD